MVGSIAIRIGRPWLHFSGLPICSTSMGIAGGLVELFGLNHKP